MYGQQSIKKRTAVIAYINLDWNFHFQFISDSSKTHGSTQVADGQGDQQTLRHFANIWTALSSR